MGPSLIFDKSAIQSLSFGEVYFLNKFFHVVVVPTLCFEIIADLEKKVQPQSPDAMVTTVAAKLMHFSSFMCVDHHSLIRAEMLGTSIEMAGRPHVASTYEKRGEEVVLVAKETKLESMLRRWKEGNFDNEDREFARSWRSSSDSVDFALFKKNVQAHAPHKVKLENLGTFFDMNVSKLDQFQFLNSFLKDFNVDNSAQNVAIARWKNENHTSFATFAPYAFFCARTHAIFQLAVTNSIVGPRSSDAVDVQYLYYLPFCNAFISGDNLHRTLTPFLLRSDQEYVSAQDLKVELRMLSTIWNSHEPNQRANLWETPDGLRPPTEAPIIRRLWHKYLNDSNVSDEAFAGVSKIEFSRTLGSKDYCPCQSGKVFTECHGRSQPESA